MIPDGNIILGPIYKGDPFIKSGQKCFWVQFTTDTHLWIPTANSGAAVLEVCKTPTDPGFGGGVLLPVIADSRIRCGN